MASILPRYTLRIPEELFDKIDEKAKKKGMSRNSYILWILDEYHNLDIDGYRNFRLLYHVYTSCFTFAYFRSISKLWYSSSIHKI
jgi:hypothetical protein